MKPETLLTTPARRHLRLLAGALAPLAGRLERRFRAILRARGYNAQQTRAMLAITPVAAARARSLSRFLEEVEYNGRRLAKCDAPLVQVNEVLNEMGIAIEEALAASHAPAREQLRLITAHALQEAWYQVREAEAQVFYGLAHAEAKAAGLDDLLARFVRILTRAFDAKAGRLVLSGLPPSGRMARELYTAKSLPEWEGHASYWSFPVRSLALIQLAFGRPYPWLPRERTMMRAVAERCAAAIERVRLNADLDRLEAEARHAEEEERRRIGRELHDDTAQSLLLLRLQLEMMERSASEDLRPKLQQSRLITERAIGDLRRTIAALSPAVLERLGLDSALRHLAARFRKAHAAEVAVRISPTCLQLPPAAQEVVYRVAQESLQNISKHSQATRVNLCLTSADKWFRLRVSDNGAGFRAELAMAKPLGFGLAGMRERAALFGGTLAVRSVPGKGAAVTLALPRTAAAKEN